MKQLIYTIFALGFLGIVTMSNQKGRAEAGGKGSTGAPGDDATVCRSCHNGPIDAEVKIFVLDGLDTVQAYEPSKTYSVHVRVNKTGGNDPKAYGFQLTMLNAADKVNGPNLKDIVPVSSNVKLTTLRNRLYAEHTDRSEKNLFELQWVAPVKGSGPVTIYAGGTAVNANGSDSGDGGNKAALQINEKSSTLNEQLGDFSWQVYPNPFASVVYLQHASPGPVRYEILDLGGRTITKAWIQTGQNALDLSMMKDGIYFIRCFDQQQNILGMKKLVKRALRP